MVPAGNKAKLLSWVNHTTKIIHYHYHHHHHHHHQKKIYWMIDWLLRAFAISNSKKHIWRLDREGTVIWIWQPNTIMTCVMAYSPTYTRCNSFWWSIITIGIRPPPLPPCPWLAARLPGTTCTEVLWPGANIPTPPLIRPLTFHLINRCDFIWRSVITNICNSPNSTVGRFMRWGVGNLLLLIMKWY